MLTEVGGAILSVEGTISQTGPFTVEEWRQQDHSNQQVREQGRIYSLSSPDCGCDVTSYLSPVTDFPEMVQYDLEL